MRRLTWAQPVGVGAGVEPGTDGDILRRYYAERDFITSPEGIMKLVSIILCVVLSVLLFSVRCAGGARSAGAALELAGAGALAVLSAARMLQFAVYAPMAYLLADLIVSTVMGILLLVTAALSLTLCALETASDYLHGPLAMATAGVVTGSAVVTFVSVTRHGDAARGPQRPAPRRPPPDMDV